MALTLSFSFRRQVFKEWCWCYCTVGLSEAHSLVHFWVIDHLCQFFVNNCSYSNKWKPGNTYRCGERNLRTFPLGWRHRKQRDTLACLIGQRWDKNTFPFSPSRAPELCIDGLGSVFGTFYCTVCNRFCGHGIDIHNNIQVYASVQPLRNSSFKNLNQCVTGKPSSHLMVLLPLRHCRRPSILRPNFPQVLFETPRRIPIVEPFLLGQCHRLLCLHILHRSHGSHYSPCPHRISTKPLPNPNVWFFWGYWAPSGRLVRPCGLHILCSCLAKYGDMRFRSYYCLPRHFKVG